MNSKKHQERIKIACSREFVITVPTVVTIARIILTPCIVMAMLAQQWGMSFVLFGIAAISDAVDGALARWCQTQTMLGALLDPIADKILLISCFATLTLAQSPLFSIPMWFLILILVKEALLVMGVAFIYGFMHSIEIKPTKLSKSVTAVQMAFIMWLFSCYFFNWVPAKTYYTMLTVLAVLVSATLIQYGIYGFRYIRSYATSGI